MQPQTYFIPISQEEPVKENKMGKKILAASFIFIVIIGFFATIQYSSLYTNDSIVFRHIKVFDTYMKSTKSCVKDVPALKEYYYNQHDADYAFGLLLFILTLSSFGIWILIFLNIEKRGIFNSRLSHFLLFFINFVICVCCIVCFIYYMSDGEYEYEKLINLQTHIGKWEKNMIAGASAPKSSVQYIKGYLDSILDINRPFVIINFILAIIYLIVSFALIGMQASKERAFRPIEFSE